ncbi:MAG: hypothetical protein ACI86C_001840 [Candidatus Latescibacterota bacterium]|jgi:hypothetical protein
MSMAVNIITMSSHNLVIAMKPPIAMLVPTVVLLATPTCFQSTTNIQKPQAKMDVNSNQPVPLVTGIIPTGTCIIIKLAIILTTRLPSPRIYIMHPLIIPWSPSTSSKTIPKEAILIRIAKGPMLIRFKHKIPTNMAV